MKKSLVAGLFATSALAGGSYKTTTYESIQVPLVDVQIKDYPQADIAGFKYGIPSSGSYESANAVVQNAINNAKSTIVSSDRSIDSLFLRLPALQEIDRLILNADSVAILKTIQTVATNDSLTCDQRIAYLLEVLGRVRAAVEKKQFHADQLKVIIDGARVEIDRIQTEIDRLEGQIKNLFIDQLQKDLKAYLADLEDLYKRFNAVEREIAPKEATLEGYKREVTLIQQASDGERNKISTDQLKLAETRALIRELQNKLADAREQRGTIEAAIKRSEAIIRDNDAKIGIARDNIRQLEFEIRRLQDEVDGLRGKYSDLEIEVERLRTEISIAETKADAYRAKIAEYNDRITLERKKLVQPELDTINDMISTLKRLIPSVQSEIDRHYYYCYGKGVKETQAQGVVVFIVQGERFQDYLQSNYGSDIVKLGPNNLQTNDKEVRFRTCDIFGKTWTNNFGYPFSETSLGGDSNKFDIAGSFNCLAPSKAHNSAGKIKGVFADYIDVDGFDGQNYQLSLGSCSRVQAQTQVPKVGQRIAFTGVPNGKGNGKFKGYNTYKASCY